MQDPDLEIRGRGGGGQSARPLNKVGAVSSSPGSVTAYTRSILILDGLNN